MPDEIKNGGPKVSAPTMSLEELSTALVSIRSITEERDRLRMLLHQTQIERDRNADRVQLIQNELEKAQADRDMFMRSAAKWAERVMIIASMAEEAKKIVQVAMAEGLLPSPPAEPLGTVVVENTLP